MEDKILTLKNGSLLQHGKLNDRVYLMKLLRADFPEVLEVLGELASEHGYTKIFCKVPQWAAPRFFSEDFILEAYIPKFYNRSEGLFFVSRFLSQDRLLHLEKDMLLELSRQLLDPPDLFEVSNRDRKFDLQPLQKEHAGEIVQIYKAVFETYPFPIFNPDYIRSTMDDHIQYHGARYEGKLVALSSAEVDRDGQNAEMTDFATLPEFRGKNLATQLLASMEKEMQNQNITTLYTIARLNSIAMNRTFLKLGYRFAGTLKKNTNIAGKLESMNVLYKHVSPEDSDRVD